MAGFSKHSKYVDALRQRNQSESSSGVIFDGIRNLKENEIPMKNPKALKIQACFIFARI